jgi:hypothetical protein
MAVISAMAQSIKWEDSCPGQPGQKVGPNYQTNQSKEGWMEAWVKQYHACLANLEFKPQYCQKKKKKRKRKKRLKRRSVLASS